MDLQGKLKISIALAEVEYDVLSHFVNQLTELKLRGDLLYAQKLEVEANLERLHLRIKLLRARRRSDMDLLAEILRSSADVSACANG